MGTQETKDWESARNEHLPRGLRNNNPCNIVKNSSNHWQGEVEGLDKHFCTFKSIEYGIRAAFRLLARYYESYRLHSVRAIISRWAPPNENDTNDYVKFVAKYAGLRVAQRIPSPRADRATWCSIVMAMIYMENGDCFSEPEMFLNIYKAYNLAFD